MRVGIGYDVHALSSERSLVLGGITIPHHQGLLGHSDADVALHALIDALLGAASLGDIGTHFPDTDESYKNIKSTHLLEKVRDKLLSLNYQVGNVDITIVAEAPRLAKYIPDMRQTISQILDIPLDRVSIKATTTEGLGFTGRNEGIAAYAVASIYFSLPK